MNTNIKVSVIIPVYNMAKWVGNAIEKVENQTLKELEIICIDDGSTDNTLEVLQEYKKRYPNLRVIHQENTGSGLARNNGIMHASGEYVVFLDADDYYYSEDALVFLYTKAKENNAVVCRGSSCDDRDGILSYQGLRPERSFSEDKVISSQEFPGPTGMWSGIYQRQFLLDHDIFFPNYIRGQDGVFSVKVIAAAGQVYCFKKVVYVYRKEHKTVVYTGKKALDAVKNLYDILQIALDNGMIVIFNAWKREMFGEPGAMLYKGVSNGNENFLEYAHKINGLTGGGLLEDEAAIKEYVDETKRNKLVFLNRLKEKEAVYVFGAGTIGKKVVDYLKSNDIILTAVIVSDLSQNPEEIDGTPVKTICDIRTDCDYVIIIATFPYSHESISHTLQENGIENIIPLDLCAFYLWQDEIIH